MAERLTQKGRLPEHYLLPLENSQVKADIQSSAIEGGEEISFTLTPDTADVPAPFRPFMTQYDTYLMKYRDVVED